MASTSTEEDSPSSPRVSSSVSSPPVIVIIWIIILFKSSSEIFPRTRGERRRRWILDQRDRQRGRGISAGVSISETGWRKGIFVADYTAGNGTGHVGPQCLRTWQKGLSARLHARPCGLPAAKHLSELVGSPILLGATDPFCHARLFCCSNLEGSDLFILVILSQKTCYGRKAASIRQLQPVERTKSV